MADGRLRSNVSCPDLDPDCAAAYSFVSLQRLFTVAEELAIASLSEKASGTMKIAGLILLGSVSLVLVLANPNPGILAGDAVSEAERSRVGDSAFATRHPSKRGELVRKYGGSDESEAAVDDALKWLAEHQMADGGWNFDYRGGRCAGRCDHAGTMDTARNAATAMALLSMLGAGQTHEEGKYAKQVAAGLKYLLENIKVQDDRGTFEEPGGNMYSHGLATLALCEAYGMTRDSKLLDPAKSAINHIIYAQDPIGGGWRYQPRQPGDTSVLGWQLAALRSGQTAHLNVPADTLKGANGFLDTVSTDDGASYGYTVPGAGSATTCIGLWSRMQLGWPHDKPALVQAMALVSQRGMSARNSYYNYYATQAAFQYGDKPWETWNQPMRDFLVERQSKDGHAKGSWFIGGDHHGSERAGRLYCTFMATMVLEVYYRYPRLYEANAK
jgi:hypothetical protein